MRIWFSALVVLALAMVAGGCGKSSEEKEAELDMKARIDSLVNDVTTQLGQLDDLSGELAGAIRAGDSLAAYHHPSPASGVAEELRTAQKRLLDERDTVHLFMQNRQPFDLTRPHEAVMAHLSAEKKKLEDSGMKLRSAIAAARKAIDRQKAVGVASVERHRKK
jgi:hypothetical protein